MSALTVVSTALEIDGHEIRRDGDMWCLTDLWRAGRAPKDQRPVDWLRGSDARRFIDFLSDSIVGVSHVRKKAGNPNTGQTAATWAHWQIALAYAKALSPAFHARVNDVYRAFTAGQLTTTPSRDRDDLVRLSLRIEALAAATVDSVWNIELKVELARLRKIGWNGQGIEPRGLAFAYGRTWRIILGDAVYHELKTRNPHPRDGSLHAAWLQERRCQMVRREDLVIALVLARRCSRWREYEAEMRSHFQRAPIQLRLVQAAAVPVARSTR
jgi:hypothetical protein